MIIYEIAYDLINHLIMNCVIEYDKDYDHLRTHSYMI